MSTAEILRLWTSLGIPHDYAAQRHLSLQVQATDSDLIEAGPNPDGRVIRLTRGAAVAWAEMKSAAARDGIELIAISGFRSIARQSELIRAKLAAGQTIAAILRVLAAPGCSEHHTGTALDLGTPGHLTVSENFEQTAAFRWLARRANDFRFVLSYPRDNFHGIAYEPWHWRWRLR